MSKILVIDDEPFSRELICNCLANAGFATVEADNGVEGVKSFDDSIDVVLLDLVMPKMGGSECLSRIQKHHPHVPSIVVSAKQSAKDAAEMFRCGVFHYLTKPFSADELIRSIQDAISFSKKPKPKLNLLGVDRKPNWRSSRSEARFWSDRFPKLPNAMLPYCSPERPEPENLSSLGESTK